MTDLITFYDKVVNLKMLHCQFYIKYELYNVYKCIPYKNTVMSVKYPIEFRFGLLKCHNLWLIINYFQ